MNFYDFNAAVDAISGKDIVQFTRELDEDTDPTMFSYLLIKKTVLDQSGTLAQKQAYLKNCFTVVLRYGELDWEFKYPSNKEVVK